MTISFFCIQCKNQLIHNEGDLICKTCGASYPIRDQIHYFSESGHYYTDLGNLAMEQLIAAAKEVGWKTAVAEKYYNNPFLYRTIIDETRADWQYLLPLNKEMQALDIGAGWGAIALSLARNLNHVAALEGTLDRLEFLSIRALQENVNNITPIHADIFKHPFKSEHFDLISFNGVLEWVGVDGSNQTDPREKQIQALKIAFDLLKENGFLYIGIENAFGLKYLLGEPDDHTGVKYITYLPREQATAVYQSQRQKPYRTYTYSIQGYTELLNEVGFTDIQFYNPSPDYKTIESISNLEDQNVAAYMNRKSQFMNERWTLGERIIDIESILIQTESLRHFPASYSIIARKGE